MGCYDYAYLLAEKTMKPKYEVVFEHVLEYIGRTGSRRGAFKEVAKTLYPEDYRLNPRKTVKRVWRLFNYALKRKCRTNYVELVENSVEQDMIDDKVEMNMGYYVEHHSGPIRDSSKFVKDSKANRRLFEFKKIVYAILQDLVKPKHILTSYVEEVFRDPRLVLEINKLEENIWYNGPRYAKIGRKPAALLYLVVHRIYVRHFGAGNKPEKLIKKFFEITGYAPRDLREHIKTYTTIFYDWLLFL